MKGYISVKYNIGSYLGEFRDSQTLNNDRTDRR